METMNKPQTGAKVIIFTKPYRDSNRTEINEGTLIEFTKIGDWIIELKPKSRHCFMKDIILQWALVDETEKIGEWNYEARNV